MTKPKNEDVLLGFEVGMGTPVRVPISHMAVTGQSQAAGKTSTLEALISRSGLKALAFVTKRGEASFRGYRPIPPYFQEKTSWEFVESMIESTMHQRMRFERAWIVRATKGAASLAGVQENLRRLQASSKRGMDQDIYMLLGEYLERVVPLIRQLPKSDELKIGPGLNVMDLTAYPEELQMLVAASAIRWVHHNASDTVTVIPEAWRYCPQGTRTPVKDEVVQLVRQGAALRNFVAIDSQEIASVDKALLRQTTLWLIGVQREAHEIKRSLESIPAGIKHPKPEDVAHLSLGEFYACWGTHVKKVYVQPAWMSAETAQMVATGAIPLEQAGEPTPVPQSEGRPPVVIGQSMLEQQETDMQHSQEFEERVVTVLEKLVDRLESHAGHHDSLLTGADMIPRKNGNGSQAQEKVAQAPAIDEEALFQRIVARLRQDKVLMKLALSQPEIEIEVSRPVLELKADNLRGWLALLLSEGFFDDGAAGSAAYAELKRRGKTTSNPSCYNMLDQFADDGFVTKEGTKGNFRYVKVPGLKITRREK